MLARRLLEIRETAVSSPTQQNRVSDKTRTSTTVGIGMSFPFTSCRLLRMKLPRFIPENVPTTVVVVSKMVAPLTTKIHLLRVLCTWCTTFMYSFAAISPRVKILGRTCAATWKNTNLRAQPRRHRFFRCKTRGSVRSPGPDSLARSAGLVA